MNNEEYWLKKKNVVAVSEEADEIKFFVTKKLKRSTLQKYIRTGKYGWSEDDVILPEEVVGVKQLIKIGGLNALVSELKKTDVIEIGEVTAVSLPNRQQCRPIQPGCEISVERSSNVGTLGCFVQYYSFMGRKLTGPLKSFVDVLATFGITPRKHVCLLTNNHVANKNIFKPAYNTIVQPGGQRNTHGIAKTIYNSVIEKNGVNEIDASVCELTRDEFLNTTVYAKKVLRGKKDAVRGEAVCKEGRTTGLTSGEVVATSVSTNVKFGEDLVRFRGLIMSQQKVRPGDSGSVLTDESGNIMGLIFAASPSMSFAVPIQKVLDDAGVDLI